MTDHPFDLTSQRILVAAHELGHAITWRTLDLPVTAIRVKGHGIFLRGRVSLDIANVTPWGLREERAWHIGLFGGREAQQRWCDEFGMRFDDSACAEDMDKHRSRRRTSHGVIRSRDVEAEARRLVGRHWARLVRLAPDLATHGSLSPCRV
jgi:hypothetical protein